jgi:hypothetical protein
MRQKGFEVKCGFGLWWGGCGGKMLVNTNVSWFETKCPLIGKNG